MTDWLPESPYFPAVCPSCQPDVDFRLHSIQVCSQHQPSSKGLDDELVDTREYFGGNSEAGGEDSRRMQALIRRRPAGGTPETSEGEATP